MVVLIRHAAADDYSLPLAYYHTTQPVFKTAEALELLFGALARTSVTEALYMSRRYPEHARQQLFERLVASVLDPSPADQAALRGKELASMPLDAAEEKWLQEYLAVGDGKKSKNARVVAQMRQIVTGRNLSPVALGSLAYAAAEGRTAKAGR